jgi:hypothetical protein
VSLIYIAGNGRFAPSSLDKFVYAHSSESYAYESIPLRNVSDAAFFVPMTDFHLTYLNISDATGFACVTALHTVVLQCIIRLRSILC